MSYGGIDAKAMHAFLAARDGYAPNTEAVRKKLTKLEGMSPDEKGLTIQGIHEFMEETNRKMDIPRRGDFEAELPYGVEFASGVTTNLPDHYRYLAKELPNRFPELKQLPPGQYVRLKQGRRGPFSGIEVRLPGSTDWENAPKSLSPDFMQGAVGLTAGIAATTLTKSAAAGLAARTGVDALIESGREALSYYLGGDPEDPEFGARGIRGSAGVVAGLGGEAVGALAETGPAKAAVRKVTDKVFPADATVRKLAKEPWLEEGAEDGIERQVTRAQMEDTVDLFETHGVPYSAADVAPNPLLAAQERGLKEAAQTKALMAEHERVQMTKITAHLMSRADKGIAPVPEALVGYRQKLFDNTTKAAAKYKKQFQNTTSRVAPTKLMAALKEQAKKDGARTSGGPEATEAMAMYRRLKKYLDGSKAPKAAGKKLSYTTPLRPEQAPTKGAGGLSFEDLEAEFRQLGAGMKKGNLKEGMVPLDQAERKKLYGALVQDVEDASKSVFEAGGKNAAHAYREYKTLWADTMGKTDVFDMKLIQRVLGMAEESTPEHVVLALRKATPTQLKKILPMVKATDKEVYEATKASILYQTIKDWQEKGGLKLVDPKKGATALDAGDRARLSAVFADDPATAKYLQDHFDITERIQRKYSKFIKPGEVGLAAGSERDLLRGLGGTTLFIAGGAAGAAIDRDTKDQKGQEFDVGSAIKTAGVGLLLSYLLGRNSPKAHFKAMMNPKAVKATLKLQTEMERMAPKTFAVRLQKAAAGYGPWASEAAIVAKHLTADHQEVEQTPEILGLVEQYRDEPLELQQ